MFSSVSLNVISRESLQICTKHPLGLCDVSAKKKTLPGLYSEPEGTDILIIFHIWSDAEVLKLIVGVDFQTVLLVEISESNGPEPVVCDDRWMRMNSVLTQRLREKGQLGLRITII